MMTWLLFIPAFMLLGCVVALRRNRSVYKFRTAMLMELDEIGQAEIRSGDYETRKIRARVMERVSYEDMMYRFWRPLESFYSNTVLKDLHVVTGKR